MEMAVPVQSINIVEDQQRPGERDRKMVIRLAVCTITLWLIVLLLALLVVVGVYTTRANQILVVSSVAVISVALVVASCKLNALASVPQVLEEEAMAKADPPPTYDDVLHTEAPPPPYYTVVREAGCDSYPTALPTTCSGAAGGFHLEETHQSKRPSEPKSTPPFRRWLGKAAVSPRILRSLVFRVSRSPAATAAAASPVEAPAGGDAHLRRSSSTPSLSEMNGTLSLRRWPSTPSLRASCAHL